MSNNVYNLKNIPSMPERILSALAYLTFGVIGIVLIIIFAILKTNLKPFVRYNIYQSIILGFLFFIFEIAYHILSAIFQLLQFIPIIGNFLNSFFQFIIYYLVGFPVFLGFSILATAIILIILYLAIIVILGKTPYIPFISNLIKRLT